jgi:hypothetical protein
MDNHRRLRPARSPALTAAPLANRFTPGTWLDGSLLAMGEIDLAQRSRRGADSQGWWPRRSRAVLTFGSTYDIEMNTLIAEVLTALGRLPEAHRELSGRND